MSAPRHPPFHMFARLCQGRPGTRSRVPEDRLVLDGGYPVHTACDLLHAEGADVLAVCGATGDTGEPAGGGRLDNQR